MTVDHGAAPGSRQARGRARREAIIDAAIESFSLHGFRGTSIAEVARAAGITDAGLLYHFKTKEELLLAAIERYDDIQGRLFDQLRAPGGLRAIRNFGAWGEHMERMADINSLHVTISGEHLREDTPEHRYFEARYAVVLDQITRMFDQAIGRGELKPTTDSSSEASQMLAVLDGLRYQWFFTNRRVSIAEEFRSYVDKVIGRLAT